MIVKVVPVPGVSGETPLPVSLTIGQTPRIVENVVDEVRVEPDTRRAGTVAGPLLGSFVLTPISELTRAVLRGRAGADIMLYGLILILVISFLPNGLVGWIHSRRPAPGRTA